VQPKGRKTPCRRATARLLRAGKGRHTEVLLLGAQEECISRKKFFNMMEDMKGKIRVFARVRPMLGFEADRGHKNALNIPDELTLDHIWKDKKREYNFDAVFSPDASQDKVPFGEPMLLSLTGIP
jgi:hypothetical protein